MRRSDVLMAGVQEVGPAIVYCLWRKGAVQHLPTLPKRVLQRNWNFPTIDAAMEGERKSFSKTSSMQAFKFAILDGFDSTKSRRCNCKVVVLKTTPKMLQTADGRCVLSGSSSNPSSLKLSCKQLIADPMVEEGSMVKKSSKK